MKNNSRLRVPQLRKRNAKINSFANGINAKLDHAVLPFSVAEYAFNFCFSSGVLSQGYGIEKSQMIEQIPIQNESVMAVWVYNRAVPDPCDFVMLATKNGDVYFKKNGTQDEFKILDGITLTSMPITRQYRLNGDDVIIVTTPTDGMFVWDGTKSVQKIESAPLITSMAIHFERLFVTTADTPDSVWFSEDLDPTNFGTDLDEGGFIDFVDERGRPMAALSYINYVYIFREYGISRLTAYGAQEEFGTSNLFVSSGKIYSNTISLCGDSVVFLASDGLYAFDGMTTQKILDNLTALILPSEHATALFANGKYYLSLQMDFGQDYAFDNNDDNNNGDNGDSNGELQNTRNNAMLVVDMSSGEYTISRGFDISQFVYFAKNNQVLAVCSDGKVGQVVPCGHLFGHALQKVWRIGKSDLGDTKSKNIRQLDIDTRHDISIVLHTDTSTKTLKIKGKNTISSIRLNCNTKLFGMDIVSNTVDAYISRPVLQIVVA